MPSSVELSNLETALRGGKHLCKRLVKITVVDFSLELLGRHGKTCSYMEQKIVQNRVRYER
jgi:hypothetical protein